MREEDLTGGKSRGVETPGESGNLPPQVPPSRLTHWRGANAPEGATIR